MLSCLSSIVIDSPIPPLDEAGDLPSEALFITLIHYLLLLLLFICDVPFSVRAEPFSFFLCASLFADVEGRTLRFILWLS